MRHSRFAAARGSDPEAEGAEVLPDNEDYPDTEFFKLLPTQGDREAYFPLIRGEGATVPDSQFKKAYDFFRRRLRDDSDSGEKIAPRRILEIIESCLMVVMINLSDSDDPYLIFESLNFKGSPLEQADLVRNYFLMRFHSESSLPYTKGIGSRCKTGWVQR